jgi:GTP-binding protein HflX
METVEDTLAEIEVPPIPRILVWNKIDSYEVASLPQRIGSEAYAEEVRVSALKGTGMSDLLAAIERVLASTLRRTQLLVPYQKGDIVSYLHETAVVEEQAHTADGVMMTVQLSPSQLERFSEYRV